MLVAIPSPRDIPEFRVALHRSMPGYDKVWFKNYSESEYPYTKIRDYFLEHYNNKEGGRRRYTHLAILPDDVILHKEGVDKLIQNVKEDPKKQVMMGTFSWKHEPDILATCSNLPARERKHRIYDLYRKNDVKGIIAAGWCGTPLAIIDGELISQGVVTLENDLRWNPGAGHGSSQDVVLAHDLAAHNIKLWVDTDVYFINYDNR